MQPIRGVILDVGGTLWPERRPESEADHAERAAGIAALLSADLSMARALVQALADGGALQPGAMTQDTCSDICRAAAGLGLTLAMGNSESNDVLPALALAMRAIRVAIEEPPPASSAAQAVAGSLAEVAAALHTLSAGTTMESRGML